jgi:hypothetical protein
VAGSPLARRSRPRDRPAPAGHVLFRAVPGTPAIGIGVSAARSRDVRVRPGFGRPPGVLENIS